MMNVGSTFFSIFSLRELLKNKQLWLGSSSSGAFGGVGGGGGNYTGSNYSHYRKSESLSCLVHRSDDGRFAEQELITSLKRDIEKEIIDSDSIVTHRGNIEGKFNSSEFYFEYSQEEIRGRIVIAGKMIGDSYYLRADLEEIAKGGGFRFGAKEFGRMKPAGDYYVVPFAEGDPLIQDNKLHRLGVKLVNESRKRIPGNVTNEQVNNFQYVEVWSLLKMPQHLKRHLQRKDTEQQFEASDEYNEYEVVYFMNEVALRMYRDSGIELEVLKKVSGDEMPTQCVPLFSGPYIC